ncbi:MAG: HD family phosphohydrolase [Bacteroides sp.]
MNQIRTKKELSVRDLLYRVAIFVVTVSVIVYFMPRDGKFNYQFDINKPWKYGQVMATFDFPIYKTDEVVRHEQDSLLRHFQPYFVRDREVAEEALRTFRADCQGRLKRFLPSAEAGRLIERKLSEYYEQGILLTEELSQLRRDSISGIHVIEDKLSVARSIGSVCSELEAYQQILTADTARLRPEMLRRLGLNAYLNANLHYDQQRTQTARQEMLNNYSWATGLVMSGQKIIDRGEIVSRETYNILQSLQKESLKRSGSITQKRLMLGGQLLFAGIFMLCFMLYLDLFRKDYYAQRGSLALLFALIVFYCVVTNVMVANMFFNVYIIPFAMLPIMVRVFLDTRTAFMAHTVTILICSISLRYPHEFILTELAAGLVAIFSLRELSQRSQLFRTALLTLLTYTAVYLAFELIAENDVSKIQGSMFIYLGINALFLLFAYPLMFLIEKAFGFTSNVTLVELSNINNPLLRRMSETVPGTFQHSMQMANLAAEAANRIGANSQLVRTGALYHDIGKMENPAFFTENQSAGINPHKSLSYEQSAQVVISHVTDGLRLADKHNLPRVIRDFITTHHGAGTTRYFYISWKNEHPGEEPPHEMFHYPGPNPFTKEQAILMMADSVEAASRSLPEYTEESISNLVERIIDAQVNEGYFRQCPITFRDIDTVKGVFKEKLRTIYHTRISYPELKTKNN